MKRLGEILRSLAFYVAFYSATVLFVLAALMALVRRPAFVVVVHGWSRYHRWCVERLLGITICIQGEIPDSGVLVAVKHESFFEAIDLPTLLAQPAIFAKSELIDIPLWGRAAATYGVVPVQRDQGARALRGMIASARKHAANGRVLAIFPEGTRVPHGSAPALRSGFAGLYKLLGLPVIPIAVDSGPTYQRVIKRRGTITLRAGTPIPPGLPRYEIEARVREAINALNISPDEILPQK